MIIVREARLPGDADLIQAIDTSFTTDTIYTVNRDRDGMSLQLKTLPACITKRFPLNDLGQRDKPWEFALIAIVDDRIAGFLAAGYKVWNRRLTIWHLYVDGPRRKQGIARLLLDRAEHYGIAKGALNMWLETSSLNVAGVRAYRRLGFELCGLDATLYDGTPASGETALFFARPIPKNIA